MIRLIKRFQTMMMAAAFAEEGEYDSARQVMKESELRKIARPSAVKRRKPDNRKGLRVE